MAEVLLETGRRANRPGIVNQLHRSDEQHRQENIRRMHELADSIVAERRQNPQPDSHDLLNTMLYSVDKETGEGLPDENIRFNMCTFLVTPLDSNYISSHLQEFRLLDMRPRVPLYPSAITILSKTQKSSSKPRSKLTKLWATGSYNTNICRN